MSKELPIPKVRTRQNIRGSGNDGPLAVPGRLEHPVRIGRHAGGDERRVEADMREAETLAAQRALGGGKIRARNVTEVEAPPPLF